MADLNEDGIIDDNELKAVQLLNEGKHTGRKFVFSVGVALCIFGIVLYLLFREKISEALQCIPFILTALGIYCGANVAQEFGKRH